MLPADKDRFDKLMIGCFQNFRVAVSAELLDEWFEELKEFNLFCVENAFRQYKREKEWPPPVIASIINLAIKASGEYYSHLRDNKKNKCHVANCFSKDIEECSYNRNVMVCRFHMDEMTLELEPDSPGADNIRLARQAEKERNELGLTGSQYVKLKNPELFRCVEKMSGADRVETARKKIIVALGDFYDTKLSPEEREKIVGEMRTVAIAAKTREEVPETEKC